MAHILITSGPTRQYLDPVRYLSNASSGQMGCCLAQSAIAAGHQVTVISGPVNVSYPESAEVINVVSTEEMFSAATDCFAECDGVIAAAAPCDFKPAEYAKSKIKKLNGEIVLRFVETADILATLGELKSPSQWSIGFALETDNGLQHAYEKLKKKNCDLIVLNGPGAINSGENEIQIIGRSGKVTNSASGPKLKVAEVIIAMIETIA